MLAGEILDRVRTEPGVYLFKDSRGGVIAPYHFFSFNPEIHGQCVVLH
ncbi:MAG: hypothetical protein AB7O24_16045 [Kofleriaceae bacterium]